MKLYMVVSTHEGTITVREAHTSEDGAIAAFRKELVEQYHYHPDYIDALDDEDLFAMLADNIESTEFVVANFTAHI